MEFMGKFINIKKTDRNLLEILEGENNGKNRMYNQRLLGKF